MYGRYGLVVLYVGIYGEGEEGGGMDRAGEDVDVLLE